MLTAAQVCRDLNISRDTFLKLIELGELSGAMKVPPGPTGHWRVPEQAIADYMERNAHRPDPKAAAPS
jgi:excisionase family DNA binding protein